MTLFQKEKIHLIIKEYHHPIQGTPILNEKDRLPKKSIQDQEKKALVVEMNIIHPINQVLEVKRKEFMQRKFFMKRKIK